VLEIPTSGCPEGHTYCRDCLEKALKKARKCPACRHPVTDSQLRRNRPLEGVITRLRVNCKHASPLQFSEELRRGDGGVAIPPAAKRARLTPAADLTAEELATALREHGLEVTGEKEALAARLQDYRDAAFCTWAGTVGELGAHLQQDCPWQPVVCTNAGCGQTWARRKMVEHVRSACEFRRVPCQFCATSCILGTVRAAHARMRFACALLFCKYFLVAVFGGSW
jgi:hypothetical protein